MATKRAHYFTGKPCKYGHIDFRSYGNCAECHRQSEKKRRIKNASPPKVPLTLEERVERQRAANRRSYEKYREKRAIAAAVRYAANTERMKAANKARYDANLERSRAGLALRTARRRALKLGAIGTHTIADREFVWRLQRGRCAYAKFNLARCHGKITRETAEWDHIVPLYLGGSNDAANGQWLCYSCNASKGCKEEMAFLRQRGVEDLFVCMAV